jgi:hypothetical protein
MGEGFEMTARGPGPSSMVGLSWLVKVGPASLGAWGVAMGWGQAAVYSHSRRLRAEGLIDTCRRVRGEGTLVYASRAGVERSGVRAAVIGLTPAKVTWPHWEACGWSSAWFTARGRELIGGRELLLQPGWRGELRWKERGESRGRNHRPDLAARLADGSVLPVEVELSEKSSPRLAAVLQQHRAWVRTGQSAGVIYVCANEAIVERVVAEGEETGLSVERGTLRVEVLAKIQRQAVEARPGLVGTAWHLIGTVID